MRMCALLRWWQLNDASLMTVIGLARKVQFSKRAEKNSTDHTARQKECAFSWLGRLGRNRRRISKAILTRRARY